MIAPCTIALNNEPGPLTFDERFALAIDPPDAATKAAILWYNAWGVDWWGPYGDPGGDPVTLEHDRAGSFVRVCGHRVPASVDGAVLRFGIRDRVGFCTAWALGACDRLLQDPAASNVTLTFGRAFGSGQTWAEFADASGRSWVSDLMLSSQPFDRDGYLAALHARAGTRIPIPDRAYLDAFVVTTRFADPWSYPRDWFLKKVAATRAAEGAGVMGISMPLVAAEFAGHATASDVITGLAMTGLAAATAADLAGTVGEVVTGEIGKWEARNRRDKGIALSMPGAQQSAVLAQLAQSAPEKGSAQERPFPRE